MRPRAATITVISEDAKALVSWKRSEKKFQLVNGTIVGTHNRFFLDVDIEKHMLGRGAVC